MAISWVWEHKCGKVTPWNVCKWGISGFLLVSFFSAWYGQRDAFIKADSQLKAEQGKVENRDTQITVLQNQVQNQQSTINEALVQLGKAQQLEPLKITYYFLGVIAGHQKSRIASYQGDFIVLTNKIITPVKLLVTCDGEIVQANGYVLGTSVMAGGGYEGRVTNNKKEYGIGILSPAWTPTNPLIVTLYTNQKEIDCSFSQR